MSPESTLDVTYSILMFPSHPSCSCRGCPAWVLHWVPHWVLSLHGTSLGVPLVALSV